MVSSVSRVWLVSVKHKAHSGDSVRLDDEPRIVERVERFRADGFIGFYSTLPSTGLENLLDGLEHRFAHLIFDKASISQTLLTEPALDSVFQQYLPKSYAATQGSKERRLRLATEIGVSLYRDQEVVLDLSDALVMGEDGFLRFSDSDLEDSVTACVIAQGLRRGCFAILKHFVSFRPVVWEALQGHLAEGIDNEALAGEIEDAGDSQYLRILIAIAGCCRAEEATEAICRRLVYGGRAHRQAIQSLPVPVTPFFDVVKTTLLRFSDTVLPVVSAYMEEARAREEWQAKQVLESVARGLRRLRKEEP